MSMPVRSLLFRLWDLPLLDGVGVGGTDTSVADDAADEAEAIEKMLLRVEMLEELEAGLSLGVDKMDGRDNGDLRVDFLAGVRGVRVGSDG